MYLTGFKMSRQDEKWTFAIAAWGILLFLFILPKELYGFYIIVVGCIIIYWFFKDILW